MKKRKMMKGIKKITVVVILLFFSGYISAAVDGSLDVTFNNNGYALTDFGSNAAVQALAVQPDGKIVAAGYSQENGQNVFAVFRYNSDGSSDASFGSDGRVITRFGRSESASGAQAVLVQPDGKIVAGGFTNVVKNSYRACLARYNTDGSLDATFFGGMGIIRGTVITNFGAGDDVSQLNDLALQTDGKIVAVGTSFTRPNGVKFAIARYNSNGTLDIAQFNPNATNSAAGTVRLNLTNNGIQHDEAHAVAIQPNGKIVVAGSSFASGVKTFALARLQANGLLDNSFYSGGLATIPGSVITSFACGETDGGAYAVLIQPDEKIVAAGYTNSNIYQSGASRFALARYDSQGRLDKSFGGKGLATIPGTVISGFDNGEKTSRINALLLQADGKLVALGSAIIGNDKYSAIARYRADGSADGSLNKLLQQKSELFAGALQANGSLLVGGIANAQSLVNGFVARYVFANNALAAPTINQPVDGAVTIDGSAIQISGSAQNPGTVSVMVNGKPVTNALVHGSTNYWSSVLPALGDGTYTINALEHYNAGKVVLAGSPVSLTVDLNPKGVDTAAIICANTTANGELKAVGASGNYAFSILSSTNGLVALNGNQYEFIPSVASGFGSFTFQVTDLVTNGTGTGTVTITVRELPMAPNFEATMCQDTQLNGNLNNGISSISAPYYFEAVGSALNGAVVVSQDGAFNFVPAAGFAGDASFQYQIVDGNGCISVPSTVTIHVSLPPVALDNNVTILQDTQLAGNLNELVMNGSAPFQFAQVGAPINCTVGIKPNGSFLLVPSAGFNGVATFAYQLTDANNCVSNLATVAITVNPLPVPEVEQAPVVESDSAQQPLAETASEGAQFSQAPSEQPPVAESSPEGVPGDESVLQQEAASELEFHDVATMRHRKTINKNSKRIARKHRE